jgi:UDP-hydrolysing UDP-N-acetyl-D-glucosamine 2-epimerase
MLEADGLDQCVVEKVYHEVEGGNPQSRTLSSAALCAALAPVYARLAPDIVLLIGDRFEALGAATAAFLGGFCIAHIQGGEVSRTIDDTTRHAITKLAHYHFASTDRAALRIGRMGEVPEHVFWTGCPSSDLVSKIVRRTTCPGEVLCIYHPDEVSSEADIKRLFNLLKKVNRPVSYWWPNIDTGSDVISKILRQQNLPAGRIYKNLHPVDYLNWLSEAAVLVGNSSSFVREAGYFGIPTLLIGDRQNGRESHREVYPRTESVIDEHLLSALNTWKPSPGWAPSNSPYYHEGASAKIVSLLATLDSITTKTYYQGSI